MVETDVGPEVIEREKSVCGERRDAVESATNPDGGDQLSGLSRQQVVIAPGADEVAPFDCCSEHPSRRAVRNQ
jgi:hypothetical protein